MQSMYCNELTGALQLIGAVACKQAQRVPRALRYVLLLISVFIGTQLSISAGAQGSGKVSVLTQHNDNARTGLNAGETLLTPATIAPSGFGQIFAHSVDGYVYAQPLIVPAVTIAKHGVHNGVHDVLIVATEHNSVYAFDANDINGANYDPLWQVSMTPAGASTVPNGETGTGDIVPEVGITGTPVIDASTNTIYLIAKTKESGGYVQRLHALDVATGEEKFGGPVAIQASVSGTGDGNNGGVVPFDTLREHNRPGLLLVNGTVYIGWASHGDNGPYHGWVIGYDAKTLKQTAVHNSCPNGGLSGYWMAGSGLATDGSSIFAATGNGTFTANNNGKDYGDSFVRLNLTDLVVKDYFSPFNNNDLNNADADLGSGGVLVLPDSLGSSAHPHLIVGCGKEGKIYLIDRDKMGGFQSNNDSQIVQSLGGAVGGTWSMPALFDGKIYYNGAGDVLKAFSIANGAINPTPARSNVGIGFPGATPSVSANGTADGIVWLLQTDGYGNGGPAVLHAFDAQDVSRELYNSSMANGRDTIGGAVKFAVPTVANGKVYVGAQYQVAVFGQSKWVDNPIISPPGAVSATPVTVTISDTTPGAQIYYTLDGTDPTPSSTPYTGPIVISTLTNLQARAYLAGYSRSGAAQATFDIGKPGNGTGLLGSYFAAIDLTGKAIQRIDPTVNFDWNGGAPINGVGGSNWSARWEGLVQPRATGTVTFYTVSDDGVRLWVDNKLLIDNWTYHAPETDSGAINLIAGNKYPIRMEFFQGGGGSVASLSWSVIGLPPTIVPQSQLFPPVPPPPPVLTITPYLKDYVGPRALPVKVGLYKSGTLVAGYPVNLTLDGGGSVKIAMPDKGTYDVLITVPGFLSRRVRGLPVTQDLSIAPLLYLGDVDRDNAISLSDLRAIHLKLNRRANGDREDVNGDGVISLLDFNLAVQNVGRTGDR